MINYSQNIILTEDFYSLKLRGSIMELAMDNTMAVLKYISNKDE